MTHQHADDSTNTQGSSAQAQQAQQAQFGLGSGACSPSGQLYAADTMLRAILGIQEEGELPSLMSLAVDHGEAGDLLDWLTELDAPSHWTLTLANGRRALLLRAASARTQGVRQIALLAQALAEADPSSPIPPSPQAANAKTQQGAASTQSALRIQRAETIEHIVCGVAHDINNQLMVLMSGVYMLQAHAGADDEALQEMVEATQRMSELTGALQALARNDGAQRVTFDLSAKVHQSRKLLLRALSPQVTTSFALDAGAGAVVMTEEGWAALLINIAWGARQALGSAGGGLLIATSPRAQLQVTLQPPSATARAHQRDAEAMLSQEPLCCGAMTLRALCEALGVQVTQTSPAALALHLPQGARQPLAASPVPALKPAPERAALHALLVIHADESREALARLLTTAQHTVTATRSAGDALLAAEILAAEILGAERAARAFDVVIADVALPALNGCALVARLREATPGLRAVVFGDVTAPALPNLVALPWPCPPARILAALFG